MNIIIPMAGAGSRFSQAGFTVPKPLIDVHGKAMYRWATDSLPLEQASNLVFILRQDDFTAQTVDDIEQHYAAWQPKITILPTLTRGQAETVYLAKELLDLTQPTLIHNADTAFVHMQLPSAASFGALVVFEPALNDARFSFAKTLHEDSDQVIEVREKVIISRHASTGTYYFADTQWMLNTIAHSLEQNLIEQGEFYLAPLYNLAIQEGHYVQTLNCQNFTCLGTPEELAANLADLPTRLQQQTKHSYREHHHDQIA